VTGSLPHSYRSKPIVKQGATPSESVSSRPATWSGAVFHRNEHWLSPASDDAKFRAASSAASRPVPSKSLASDYAVN
jgi:hypothetical protein